MNQIWTLARKNFTRYRLMGILFLGLLLSNCDSLAAFEKRLLGEYALPNGYTYISETGQHEIKNENLSVSYLLGTFLNRVYVDNRYVLGEVSGGGECLSLDGSQGRHCYFVFDTVNGEYISGLSLEEFEEELTRIEMSKDVELVSRREKDWWKPTEE